MVTVRGFNKGIVMTHCVTSPPIGARIKLLSQEELAKPSSPSKVNCRAPGPLSNTCMIIWYLRRHMQSSGLSGVHTSGAGRPFVKAPNDPAGVALMSLEKLVNAGSVPVAGAVEALGPVGSLLVTPRPGPPGASERLLPAAPRLSRRSAMPHAERKTVRAATARRKRAGSNVADRFRGACRMRLPRKVGKARPHRPVAQVFRRIARPA
jgi:hypothetical protein